MYLELLKDYSYFVLAFAIFLLLAALMGGSRISVRDFGFGPIGRTPRIICSILSVPFGLLFFVIPDVEFYSVNGIFVTGPYPDKFIGKYSIHIRRSVKNKLIDSIFRPDIYTITRKIKKFPIDTKGSFHIPTGAGIYNGAYYLKYISDSAESGKDMASSKAVILSRGDYLIIQKDIDGQYFPHSRDPVEYFVEQYRKPEWQYRVSAIEHLARFIENDVDESVKKSIVALFGSDSDTDRQLAAFVFGRACNSAGAVWLKEIYAQEQRIFPRLRAAANLMCIYKKSNDPKYSVKKKFLLGIVKTSNGYADNSTEWTYRVRAAIYLLNNGIRSKCVIDRVIVGLQKGEPEIREQSRRSIIIHLYFIEGDKVDSWSITDVATWWNLNSGEYEDC